MQIPPTVRVVLDTTKVLIFKQITTDVVQVGALDVLF